METVLEWERSEHEILKLLVSLVLKKKVAIQQASVTLTIGVDILES